jgi:phosphoribosylformimino-5-aminoimidazole carboxamide ribotide isomerase
LLVVPAIDIRGGKCVRLVRGDYSRETVFGDDPAAMAKRWLDEGARALHLVDLDGARSGNSDNANAVKAILREVARAPGHVTTELGGGIRDLDAIEHWLGAGIDRVIIGTAAVRDPALVSRAAERFPGRVWVGVDARDGKVAVSGWTEETSVHALQFSRAMESRGAAGIIYTDIERDGTGSGVNAEATARIAAAVGILVFASGGVHGADDVVRLRNAGGIAGVIVGRALYDGAVTLAELLAAAEAG